MSPRALARLILDATALAWLAAVSYGVSGLFGDPVPLWLPLLAYILTALPRRVSQRLGILGMVVVCVLGALAEGRPDPMAFLVSAAVSYRALTTQKDGAYWALRTEFILSIWLVIAVAILGTSGSPPTGLLVLPALLVVAAGLFGLPFVHSLDAAGHAGSPAARSGQRLGALILGASAVFSLLIEGLRLLYLGGQLAIIGTIAYYVYYPFMLLFFWLGELLLGHFRYPKRHGATTKIKSPGALPKPHAPPAHALFVLHLSEFLLLLAVGAVIVYLIYRRAAHEESASGELNTPSAAQALSYTGITRRRRRLSFGEGARGRVRAAVGHHVLPQEIGPAETARRVAQREGWPEEALSAYERARYRLDKPFEDEEASSFLRRFAQWRQARRRRP